jgi:DNA-binding MarR family transcriptional regulator
MDRKRDLLSNVINLARLIRTEVDKRARAHGMTRAQWGILIRLEMQPGLLQKELAEQLEVEPITVARLIDRLESRGMVERRPDPTDRRCWRLHLTDASRPLLGEIGVQLDDVARILCIDLRSDTLDTVSAAILQMRDRAQEQRNAPLESPAEPFEELA